MIKPGPIFALFLALVPAGQARAAPPMPYSKSGLWIIDQHTEAGRTYRSKMCTDPASQAAMLRAGAGLSAQMCTKQDTTAAGAQVTIDAVCHIGPSTLTSKTVVTYTGDSAFHVVSDGAFSPAFMGKAKTHSTMDARWSGACPAGMAPGDMIGPTGVKLHVAPKS